MMEPTSSLSFVACVLYLNKLDDINSVEQSGNFCLTELLVVDSVPFAAYVDVSVQYLWMVSLCLDSFNCFQEPAFVGHIYDDIPWDNWNYKLDVEVINGIEMETTYEQEQVRLLLFASI